MNFNLLKTYPQLLELEFMNEHQRLQSLKGVFDRDIENNPNFKFRNKGIRPIKGEEPEMQILFRHLTHVEIEITENGQTFPKRVFEFERSKRLHWVLFHIEERKQNDFLVFSAEEMTKNRGMVIKTFLLDVEQRYLIVLEPYRKSPDYYLITAYYLEPRNFKKMMNKWKRRLPEVH